MPYADPKYPNKRQAHTKTTEATAGETTATRADIYQRITDQIVAAIEAGAGNWKMPWHTTQADNAVRPVNAVSKKPYRGVNTLALWIAASEQGYQTSEWATYKQWQEIGAQIRKGEKSQLVVFWKIKDRDEETQGGGSSDSEETGEASQRRVLARGYSVFNAAQVDGYTAPKLPAQPLPALVSGNKRNAVVEAFFTSTGAAVQHGGNRAFYRPSTDQIQMPLFEAFSDPINYYSTLGHETVHWTSAKHRLDRDLLGRFGSEAYAAEELVGVLASFERKSVIRILAMQG